jgi:glycosyltransferase involved in cell wall biosynthesis
MAPPRFSVIIPTYARPEFLARAVGSVFAQTVQDFEIIVVDDCSPSTLDLPIDPRIKVVRNQQNLGVTISRNVGLDNVVGDIVAFLDDDDWWLPQRLALAEDAHNAAPIVIVGQGDHEGMGVPTRRLQGALHDAILAGATVPLGRTSIAADVCPRFDPRFPASQDVEWWIRASQVDSFVQISNPGWVWGQHATVRHGNAKPARLAANKKILQDHAQYFQERPRAHAYRHLMVGRIALGLGDRRLAMLSALKGARIRPSVSILKLALDALKPGPQNRTTSHFGVESR